MNDRAARTMNQDVLSHILGPGAGGRAEPHGNGIAPITCLASALLQARQVADGEPRLSKKEKAALARGVETYEQSKTYGGVNFSRIQIDTVLQRRNAGMPVEFETFGPYLADYTFNGGVLTTQNLIAEDAIGLRLAVELRQVFPKARLVSLCDEYNSGKITSQPKQQEHKGHFSHTAVRSFKKSVVDLFRKNGAVPKKAVEGKDYLLLSESKLTDDASRLVTKLAKQGCIERHSTGHEIYFVNKNVENPLHSRIKLRTHDGVWTCAALDASGYLHPDNLEITHIVALPEYMKEQQDKVWEILRVLGFKPENYHNIFFDSELSAEQIAGVVRMGFSVVATEIA